MYLTANYFQQSRNPQGGVISPILANLTLDGIEKLLAEKYPKSEYEIINGKHAAKYKINFVRYADDFIVTAKTKEIAEEAKELIRQFLKDKGLELSEEKTLITHIDNGLTFLDGIQKIQGYTSC